MELVMGGSWVWGGDVVLLGEGGCTVPFCSAGELRKRRRGCLVRKVSEQGGEGAGG